ncbi:hypothetical protein UFOVP368_50 [uncultured Caudovirales phage]|uniref:Uncharacterized protein n=1 Tax=uncultured Caudovirales phage TaxID=2100421 RepID=A0A6J7WYE3_9CAUD|nr:hypothetical protein UFOVP368_50 [uncultured Caudovirales phage]
MTLCDAFTIYTRKLHRATMRPFLAYRVVNAANDFTRALSPSLRADTQAAGFDPFSPAVCFSIPSHDAQHNAVTR